MARGVGRPKAVRDPVVAARIKEARKAAGLTQAKLAELLNVSVQTIKNWEYGANTPSTEFIERIAEVSGLPSEYLTNREGRIRAIIEESGAVLESLDARAIENQKALETLLLSFGRSLPMYQLQNRNFVPYMYEAIRGAVELADLEPSDYVREAVEHALKLYDILHGRETPNARVQK